MNKVYPSLILVAFCVLSCKSGDDNKNTELNERREAACYDSGGNYDNGVCYCDDIACPRGRSCDKETGQCEVKQSAEETKLKNSCLSSGGVFQDGGCICNDEPCEDKQVCDPESHQCATPTVPEDPTPEEPPLASDCVSSGGVLIEDKCFCNGNLCDPGIFCNAIGICSNRTSSIETNCTESGGVFDNGICFCSEIKCDFGIFCNENGVCTNRAEKTPQVSEECKDNNDYWCENGEVFHCSVDPSGVISVRSFIQCDYGCLDENRLKPQENEQYNTLNVKKILCRECNEDLYRCEDDAVNTCKNGKIIQTKCMKDNKVVSCKNDKECGECNNKDYECYNVTINNGASDVEVGIKNMCIQGEWHEVDKNDVKNGNPNLSTLLDQYSCNYNSCRKDGQCGECLNGSATCTNDSHGIGILRECVEGAWKDINNCVNTSCYSATCGECVNDTVTECVQYCKDGSDDCDESEKSYHKGTCKLGKWNYIDCTPL